MVGPSSLGVQAMQGKSPFLAPGASSGRSIDLPDDMDGYEGYFPTDLAALYSLPEFAAKGYPVAVTGKIYHPKPQDVPDGLDPADTHTLLFHFMIRCCAADARPVAVVLSGEGLRDIPNGTWVMLQGKASRIPGSKMLGFAVDEVDDIDEPSYPYLLNR